MISSELQRIASGWQRTRSQLSELREFQDRIRRRSSLNDSVGEGIPAMPLATGRSSSNATAIVATTAGVMEDSNGSVLAFGTEGTSGDGTASAGGFGTSMSSSRCTSPPISSEVGLGTSGLV